MQSSGAAGKGKESGGGGGSRRGVAAPNFCTSCGTKGGWQRRAAGLCDSVEAAEEGSREVREAAAWALEQAESFQVDMPAARWKAVESLSRRGQQPWHAQALESDASLMQLCETEFHPPQEFLVPPGVAPSKMIHIRSGRVNYFEAKQNKSESLGSLWTGDSIRSADTEASITSTSAASLFVDDIECHCLLPCALVLYYNPCCASSSCLPCPLTSTTNSFTQSMQQKAETQGAGGSMCFV
eukprot:TRINITY_DN12856_c0_g1_i5.p1 TRINITY_DN12856_c0_g1~~TRINITY_DN12856_c0_g1_i5.p1  ORF type:complete len:240 (+),score=41.72 TRINITY_DN12856_c0_g1_i5:150-869(+)